MRIGIIGSGHIGGTLAKRFVAAGHEVAVSNSRGPETLAGLVDELGARAQAMTAADAERFGEVVVVSVPLGRYREVPADAVDGKVVIDTNNYYPSETVTSRSWTTTAQRRANCCRRTCRAPAW
jgi:predicted dinucleotide-binding enzyme